MRRSASCFKILTCGGGSADRDDVDPSENKSPGDEKRWSFRKRSKHHQVLNNTVINETPSGHNEIPEPVAVQFQEREISIDHEKTSTIQIIEEKLQLEPAESKNPEVVAATETEVRKSEPVSVANDKTEVAPVAVANDKTEVAPVAVANDETEVDVTVDESVVVIIQTAVRGFLAQKELGKVKNVIKLQAAVRGYLVRRHAIGALRCVQAIVKMQALVRARRARQSVGWSSEKKPDGNHGKDDEERISAKRTDSGTSIEKLLNNRFARQLMESTPKTKPIKIKCDPLKPNSAWNWLERWMSVSSAELIAKPESTTEQLEKDKSENSSSVDAETPSKVACESTDTKSNVKGAIVPLDSEENLISYDSNNLKFHVCQPTSVKENLKESQVESVSMSNPEETTVESRPISNPVMQTDANSEADISHLPDEPKTDSEQALLSMKISASEQLETGGKKFVHGSRKANKPVYIAAQSKFEELSSAAKTGGSLSASHKDVGAESNTDTASLAVDTISSSNELSMTETPVHDNSRVQLGDSKCGTELPVSSTLDSPERSEAGTKACDHVTEVTVSEIPNSPNLETNQLEKLVSEKGEFMDSIAVAYPAEVVEHQQKGTSAIQTEADSNTGHQILMSYPEASPKSQLTVPESQGTPSSQVSVKARKGKNGKGNQKHKSLPAYKGSPENPAHDCGSRSIEHSPIDHKNGKRHNSFGSPKLESNDQERKDINSSNALPHFMQATESARAKINASSSPRSSPDVHDRDTYIKKRHSLTGANGRQGSPRIQRSSSQAQQDAKDKERKWLR